MAGKIDKEFLVKNKFWVGLGGFVLLWLITVTESSGSDAHSQRYWRRPFFDSVREVDAAAK